MAQIPLSNGGVALVDDADFERVAELSWRRRNDGYAGAAIYIRGSYHRAEDGRRRQRYRAVLLHRFILDPPADVQVDHINGDRLNCRRANLRLCTNTQNMRNMHAARGESRFKGVSRVTGYDTWRARITLHGREVHLGVFDTQVEAAKAYDAAACEHFGRFARPNFPPQQTKATKP